MSVKDFKKIICSVYSYIGFEYNGFNCGIDPFSSSHFDMWYGDEYYKAGSIDEVMSYPLFDGRSLTEIYYEISNLDY